MYSLLKVAYFVYRNRSVLIVCVVDWDINLPSNKIPWLKLQFIVIFVLAITALIALYKRFALSVVLFLKLKFNQRPLEGKFCLYAVSIYLIEKPN